MITYVNCVGLLFQYRNLPMQNYLEYLLFEVLFSIASKMMHTVWVIEREQKENTDVRKRHGSELRDWL